MMYEVNVPMTTYTLYTVEAKSKQDAIDIVLSGEADCEGLGDYEEDLDSNNWEVEEV
jgi:hypothetical protein